MASPGRPRSFDRQEALERAMLLFWERGYEGVSLNDLTAALGINKPSLYAAFGCKEALFREAIELYTKREGSTSAEAMKREPSARAAVEAMLRNNARTYTAPGKPRGCMVVLAASVGSSESDEVRAFLASLRKHARELIALRVERGMREGDVPADADPERVASFYHTVLTGLSVQARDGASPAAMNGVIDDALSLWDVMAGAKPAPSAKRTPPARSRALGQRRKADRS